MAAGIFVSYRRADTRHVAGRLAGDLADRFGPGTIFRDVESIAGGDEFPAQLEHALDQCAAILVLIGPGWLEISEGRQRPRLDEPDDWVRLEIASALRRNIRVIPVLVEDAPMPRADQLPQELLPLLKRQALLLSDARWRGDLQALLETLAKVPGLPPVRTGPPAAADAPPARPRRWLVPGAVATALLVVLVGLTNGWLDTQADAAPPETAAAERADPPAPPAPEALPDLGGTWISDAEEVYRLQADGSQYRVEVLLNGKQMGTGTARLTGSKLTVETTEREKRSARPDAYICELTMADAYTRFSGKCRSDGEDFPFALKR